MSSIGKFTKGKNENVQGIVRLIKLLQVSFRNIHKLYRREPEVKVYILVVKNGEEV